MFDWVLNTSMEAVYYCIYCPLYGVFVLRYFDFKIYFIVSYATQIFPLAIQNFYLQYNNTWA